MVKQSPRGGDARALKANLKFQSAPNSAAAFQSQYDGQPRKSGGRASRQKGNRAERALVRALQDKGFAAERVPLSGSAGGKYCGDLTVPIVGRDHVVEVKVRATGFSQLYGWLEGRDMLVVRADRREPLVVVPLALGIEIATAAERNRRGDP
jgi:Archaeal holliday junction resolvase (hjc)